MKRDTKQIGTKKVKCFGKKRPKPNLKNTKKPKTIRSQTKTSSKTPKIQKHLFKKASSKTQKKKTVVQKKQAQKRKKKQNYF